MEYREGHLVNFQALYKWVFAAVIALWASLTTTIHLLVVLMALDFFTGLTRAFLLKKLTGAESFRGLVKKVLVFVLIYVGHSITKPLNIGFDLGEVVALAYLINEVLSIIENCAEIGVPIPPVLVQSLGKMRSIMPTNEPVIVTQIKTEEIVIIPPAKKNNHEGEHI